MNVNQILIIVFIVCLGLFFFSMIPKKGMYLLKLAVRVVLGIALIMLINAVFAAVKIPVNLGINVYSICTIAILGLPSLVALYGILGLVYL